VAALLVAGALAPRPADARRVFVPQEHRTLQAGIDAASPGDTLWVRAGVYPGPIRITKKLVVFGEGGPDSTILDGGDSTRVVHIEGVTGGQFLGFTIRRGKAAGGGGIYCLRDSALSISSCTIERNWESGIALWRCGGVAILDNAIRENEDSGISAHETSAFIRRNQFIGNRAPSGGAISLDRSWLIGKLQDCLFEKNRALAGTGGALFADSSFFAIASCTFAANEASVAGGAVSAMRGSRGTIEGSLFRENRARSGPAVHSDRATLNIALSIFDRNHAVAVAAAIQVLGRALGDVNPLLIENTFYKNSCEGDGAAIFCQSVSPEIRKSIFVVEGSVKAVLGVDSAPTYECNLIYDPSGAALGSLPSADTLVGDPRFCDPDKGDFHIRDLSPAFLARCGPIGALKKPCPSFKLVPAR
jgi:parallel beta-helix repeat protein/predicted outer membrane repeat protein